jgi:hypothetical protein
VVIIELIEQEKKHFFLRKAALQLDYGIGLETLLAGAWKSFPDTGFARAV